ncbi:unnamed protein product [Rhodiola kirilowii]
MQRQSLGSPSTKHHHHALGGSAATNGEKTSATVASHDSKRISVATSSLVHNGGGDTEDEEKTKLLKLLRTSPAASKQKSPEKLIHGIPVLTFVCFLILYLSSHDPSQLELDAFGGFKRPEVLIDSKIGSGLIYSSKGDGDAVGNRSLREIQRASKSRVHRKLGDF